MGIFTVKNEPVSNLLSWILFVPIWPIWVYAFWRIKSLGRGIPVILGAFGLANGKIIDPGGPGIILENNPVGGKFIEVDTTSLLLANVQTFSWMIPVVLSVLGIALVCVRRH